MRHRANFSLAALACAAVLAAAPAFANEAPMGGGMMPPPPPPEAEGRWQQQQADWLKECRHRLGDNGVGGGLIGVVAGGLIGREVAGRGNRTTGALAGAAVGAVAGVLIDKAEDRGRVNDRCEKMLSGGSYERGPTYGYGPGYAPYGYTYAVPVMMVPAPAASRKNCKEVVTTEYVTTYETVYKRVRVPLYKRVPVTPQYKRVPVTPDKRVRMVPDKRVRGS